MSLADLAAPDFRPEPQATVLTGAAGWLGRGLLADLASSERTLRCLVHTHEEVALVRTSHPRIQVVVGDMRDPATVDQLFDGMDGCTVLHTAGVIHPVSSVREFYDCNVGGTSMVLDRARRVRASRVVHVSSNSPFGFNLSPSDRFDGDDPYNPVGGYGRSKMEAEDRVLRMTTRGELDAVIVRPPWFYGPYQPARQSRWFSAIRRGTFPLFGDGSNVRSMVYLDNLVQGLLRAERREGVTGEAFWIADAEPYRMADILEAVRGALGRAGLPVVSRQPRLPSILSNVAGSVDETMQSLGLYSQTLHVLSEMNKNIACTIDKARLALGYAPTVTLDEGMDRSVAWCLEQGWKI